jgi:hypothetical protein
VKKLIGAISMLFLSNGYAVAEWRTGSFVDKMTDRKYLYASLQAKEGQAELYVGCVNGQISPDIYFPSRLYSSGVGVTYRFDEEALVSRIASLPMDGLHLWLWIGSGPQTALKIRKSKRLRLQVDKTFYDFDLTGGDKAISPITCK